jgi:hypothetical protein
MQGRQGRGKDPWDRPSHGNNDALNGNSNGNGKQRTLPQRPPRMARLDTPPSVQRVARPQRQQKPPKSRRRRLLITLVVLAVGALLVFVIAYGLVNYFIGIGNSAGPANTAADFLINMKSQVYDQAYKDLDATITGTVHPQDFLTMAQANDRCYGPITDFNEVPGSATASSDGNTQSFAYAISRSKLTKTYQLTLTLQKDSNGAWDITSFTDGNGTPNDLGPAPPTC